MRIGDSDPLLQPGEALDRMAAWHGRIEQLAVDTKAMSGRLAELRVSAADESRMVEVTVDAQGALLDLSLSRRIQHVEPDAVAAAIMSTIRAARLETADRAQEIIAETVGDDSPAGQALAAQVGERLGRADG